MFRLCVVGSGGVGKSSLTIRYLKNEFTEVIIQILVLLLSQKSVRRLLFLSNVSSLHSRHNLSLH